VDAPGQEGIEIEIEIYQPTVAPRPRNRQ
jgi:hypothetical protein